MLRRLLLLLAVPLVVAALLAGTSAPAAAGPASTKAAKRYAAQAHAVTNQVRAAAGLKTLRTDRCLRRYARAQAKRIAADSTLYHQDLGPVLAGCNLRVAGENVATGYANGPSTVLDGWMQSEDHRANLLAKVYRLEAIAAVKGADGRWYVAQVFGRSA